MSMTIRYLRTLIAAVDSGSFGSAADAVHITQSAVSMQMRGLETALGAKIFDRSRRPPTLTTTGRQVVESARRIVFLYDQMVDGLGNAPDDICGTLVLGAVPTTLTGLIPKALSVLRTTHPRLQVMLKSDLSAPLVESIRRGELDAAVMTHPFEPLDGISTRIISNEPLVVIAPKSAKGKNARDLLEQLPYIQFSKKAWVGRIIENCLRENAISVRVAMELDSLEAVNTMVHYGLGISIAPQSCVKQAAPLPLKRVQLNLPGAFRTLAFVERDPNPKTRLTSAVFQAFYSSANEKPQRVKSRA
jgi:DNA-binding transcriptional LysR family regulator